jgi:5'(3')-deoxyribonucleotidase
MAKSIIAVDVDDVLADSTDALRRVVNERLSTNLSPEDYRVKGDYWQYYETVWQKNGLTDRISLDDLEPMMIENQSHVEPHESAIDVLQELSKGYHLIVVTSRPPSWRRATEKWLEVHFPGIFGQIFFTRQSDDVDHETKGELCKEYGAKWLIDDNVEHAQSAADQGIDVVLFGNYGWHHKAPTHFHRCKNWTEVLEFFDARG